jgi:hypothetical protein
VFGSTAAAGRLIKAPEDFIRGDGVRTVLRVAGDGCGDFRAAAMSLELGPIILASSARAVQRCCDGRIGARTDAKDYLTGKIMHGGQGVWGNLAMPSQALTEADASAIAQWLAAGASPDHRR